MPKPDHSTHVPNAAVPTDPMQALLELRDRMQALHAQLEYAKLLLRLQTRPLA